MSVKITSSLNNNLQRPGDDALFTPSELTVCVVLKVHTSLAGTQDFISKSGSSSDLSYTLRMTPAGLIEMRTSTNGTSTNTVTFVTALVLNTRYHIAMTHSTTAKTGWLNGVQDVTAAGPGALFNSTVALHVGDRTDGNNESNVFMEDLRFYNRALSRAEIETIFACQGTDGIVEGGIARYPMDEQSPTTVVGTTAEVKDVWANGLHLDAAGTTRPSWEEGLIFKSRRRLAA